MLLAGSSGLNGSHKMDYSGSCAEELEIPLFDLSTIMKATHKFSIERKIGEGGFGPVYKVYISGIADSFLHQVKNSNY